MYLDIKCKQGYDVTAQRSPAGYFLGTFDPEEGPNCKLSSEYTLTSEDVVFLKPDRMYDSGNEIAFCNECKGCELKITGNHPEVLYIGDIVDGRIVDIVICDTANDNWKDRLQVAFTKFRKKESISGIWYAKEPLNLLHVLPNFKESEKMSIEALLDKVFATSDVLRFESIDAKQIVTMRNKVLMTYIERLMGLQKE